MTALLALSIGCPSGIGPEVSAVAASESREKIVLVGDLRVIKRAARRRGIDPSRFVGVAEAEQARRLAAGSAGVIQPGPPLAAADSVPGWPTPRSGRAQLAWVDAACDLVLSGAADAMVTGPVSKEVIVSSKAPGSEGFLGHTEYLMARLRAKEVVMAFSCDAFATSLVTTHLRLAEVPRSVTAAAVSRATFWLAWLLHRVSAASDLRIAVSGLNPHAGEGGLLGSEERRCIQPGMARAAARMKKGGLSVTLEGPVPAETAFRLASKGRYAGVVAMYHDQATIPMKLVGFGDTVNVSLGLPIVRTSVDHGTGYDIAGKGLADARGMSAAILLAARLIDGGARRPGARGGPRRSRRR